MKQPLFDTLIPVMDDLRYPPHVRTLVRTWVETSFRFEAWFLADVKHRDDEEPFSSMLDKDLEVFKVLDLATECYLAHPEGDDGQSMLAALKESIRVRTSILGDWKPKGS